ncbi:hypothetical protein [Kitasatospora purpeofusca]|uniref:hypothetical protein n=1 Tax=Kitasatospora purpeofusca TaxID=67352 RepID=UPI002259F33F|nr:hypothetical protein [Kitasatospora purpeofusca]MCX4758737.1 hypothetical protein [Kitasatospora purpeofusca]WSR30831.1 hypothetical protein OG715_07510 [Kitasatospora purpeofusca]
MVEVPWALLASQPKAVESLIGMLVLRLRPRAVPVDGSGGDGGRDLFEYAQSGELVLYEVKSFTGRMTNGRRKQVVDSLVSAARHQPDHWDLLVPIDPAPAEARWFEGLRLRFPFVRHWRGLTWLNTHFAAHPDLVRYSLHSSSDEILGMIKEVCAERAAMLSVVPDLAERHATLVRRANEASPHYGLRVATDDDGASVVEIVPRTAHIPADELITLTGQVALRKDDPEHVRLRERLDAVIRFGDGDIQLTGEHLAAFDVHAPAGLGIAGSDIPDRIRISALYETLEPPLDATVVVRTEAGLPAASLPVRFTERSRGSDGGHLYGSDLTGMFRLRLRLDLPAGRTQFTMTFAPPEQAMPSAYLPALSLIARMLPGRTVELITRTDGRSQISQPVPTSTGIMAPDLARRWADALEDLARLQRLTGHFFPLPNDFTLGDARDVREALDLLDGEKVQRTGGTVSVVVIAPEAFDHLATTGPARLAVVHRQVVFDFSGNEVDLGPMVETVVVDRVLNLPEARRDFDRDGRATVRLRIAADVPLIRYLGSELPD